MEILKIVSTLLDYPSEELQAAAEPVKQAILKSKEISPQMRSDIIAFVEMLADADIMDLQESYGEYFDRGRALSLLLFEHVHGESRDRGQAMVDLMDLYYQAGFEINRKELPDYIPMYLEYLSTRDSLSVREGLADISHILGLLSARMKERGCEYACLIDALLMISGVSLDRHNLREQAAGEERDDSLEAMDKIWEEEMVTFMSDQGADGQGCQASNPRPFALNQESASPVHWVDVKTSARTATGE